MNAHSDYLTNHRTDHKGANGLAVDEVPSLAPRSHHSVNEPPAKPPRLGRIVFVLAVIMAAALAIGLVPRVRERMQVADDTRDLAIPTVAVVNATPAKMTEPLVLSGELRPVIEASIYARANGYVRRWVVDLGAHVEAGQLLAELDTPEIDRQLSQSQAELTQAEAAAHLASTTAKRWKEMLVA